MWAFIVAACLSHILFFFEDQTRCFCRPELKNNSSRHRGTWQHDSGFKRLTRFRSRRISKLCKMKLFLSITAGCERHSLQNRRYRFYAKRINATSRYGSSLPRRHSFGSTRTPPQRTSTAVARPGFIRSVLTFCRLLQGNCFSAQPVVQ